MGLGLKNISNFFCQSLKIENKRGFYRKNPRTGHSSRMVPTNCVAQTCSSSHFFILFYFFAFFLSDDSVARKNLGDGQRRSPRVLLPRLLLISPYPPLHLSLNPSPTIHPSSQSVGRGPPPFTTRHTYIQIYKHMDLLLLLPDIHIYRYINRWTSSF